MSTLAEYAGRAACENAAREQAEAVRYLMSVLLLHSPPGNVTSIEARYRKVWWMCDIDEYSFVFDAGFIQAAPKGDRVNLPRYGGGWGLESGKGWQYVGQIADLAKIDLGASRA